MNILFINNIPFNPSLGGIERVTDILVKTLIKKRYGIYYLCGHTDNKDMLAYDFPVTMHTLPEEGLFLSEKNYKFYNDFIIKHEITIVVNQKGLDFFLNKSLEIEKVKKISVLHSRPKAYLNCYCNNIINRPTKHIDYLKTIIKTILYPLIFLLKKQKGLKILSSQYNYIVNNSNAIVLLSEKYKEEFLSCNINNKEIPIVGIPNPNTFNIQNIDWIEKEKIILYVGRINTFAKKPQRLIKIWSKIYKKHPDWKLIFIGDGNALPELKKYVKKHNISQVFFEGHQKNVNTYYKKASFICLTSDFEGWGMSLTEGMSHGCIPFTFNNYLAAQDIIDDNNNGCLIKPYSLNEYAHRLETLMNDDNERKRLAYNAFYKVKQFNVEIIIEKWEFLFNSLNDGICNEQYKS